MMRKILSEYPTVFGKVDIPRLCTVHLLTKSLRDRFLTDHTIQDVLLNDGYEINESERPKSFHDVQGPAWHKTTVSMSLMFVDEVMDAVTGTHVVGVENRLSGGKERAIIEPDSSGPILRTVKGYDAGRVERLKFRWMENLDVAEVVREYRRVLGESFDEFNMQFILSRMSYSRKIFIHPSKAFEKELELQQKIVRAIGVDEVNPSTGELYSALDNAYYGKATRIMGRAAPLWERLNGSDYGRLFILQPDELRKARAGIRSREYIMV